MSEEHDNAPRVMVQTIFVCPKCDFKCYGQFDFQIEDSVTKKRENIKYCPKCYMDHIKSLNLPEMVEWRGSD